MSRRRGCVLGLGLEFSGSCRLGVDMSFVVEFWCLGHS